MTSKLTKVQPYEVLNLDSMNKFELIELVKQQQEELNSLENNNQHTKVSALDFSIESNTESLSTCLEALNELIKSNQGFTISRKVKQNVENNLGIG